MTWLQRLRFVWRKEETDRELEAELRFHLEHQIEANLAAGMPAQEARYQALREFGGVDQIKEECRSSRGMDWLESLGQDIRYAWRGFRRSPGFALTIVAVTAVGIGATTAIFSVVDRVLFRSPSYSQADRLVAFGISAPILDFDFLTGAQYLELRRNTEPLGPVTSWSGVSDCDLTQDQPARLACARVESTFLPQLGIQPMLGRNMTAEEDSPGAPRVALLTYDLWKSRFGGRATAVGQKIPLDGQHALIIGVLPPQFELPTLDHADLLIPQALPAAMQPGSRPLRIYARLVPGKNLEQTRAGFSLLDRLLAEIPPQYRGEVRLRARPLTEAQTGDFRSTSWTLFAAALSMLLIACANAAHVLLARSMARRREIGVRFALGAGRGRLLRQALTESLLLALSGGLAGCILAGLLLRFFNFLAPAGIPHLAKAELDVRVLLFACGVALLCGVVFGLAPALQGLRPGTLNSTRSMSSPGLIARQVLISAQLAFSLVLLTCAGLLMQSLWNRLTVNLGFRTDRTVTAQLSLGPRYSQLPARLAFYEQLETRLRVRSVVEAVALSDTLPPGGVPRSQPFFAIEAEGHPKLQNGTGGMVVWRAVTPDYFRILGMPILRGRAFTEEDRQPLVQSIIISSSFARRLFPNEDPLQHRLQRFPVRAQPGGPGSWYTVIGIAADARNGGLTDSNDPEYYVVRRHRPDNNETPADSALLIRGSGTTAALQSLVRAEIAAIDPLLPVTIRGLDDHVAELAARPRFGAVLLAMFAGVGLLLAASGLYGLISFLAAQREREIGIRLALGATRAQIMKMVVGQAFRWTLGGLAVGLAGSSLAAYSLRGLLFHVSALDPFAFGAAALILVTLSVVAALVPSHRAASLDPIVILRHD